MYIYSKVKLNSLFSIGTIHIKHQKYLKIYICKEQTEDYDIHLYFTSSWKIHSMLTMKHFFFVRKMDKVKNQNKSEINNKIIIKNNIIKIKYCAY